MPFVLAEGNMIGIAADGTVSARAWRISDEAFNSIGGSKFSWIAPDGKEYVDHKSAFIRPTEEQVRQFITPELIHKGIEIGLISSQ